MSLVGKSWGGGTSYSQVSVLAQGGMGEVEVALRRGGSFERLYAVKRLHPQFRSEPDFLAMFNEEARIAGLIRHANVVSVLDVGEDDRGPFLVMEYVEGLPLSKVLVLAKPIVPLQVALRIVQQVAYGLQAAHELADHSGNALGIVHRDVSPQNILVGFDGAVKVTDFGIAKAMDGYHKTRTGVVKGKRGYLSPEQLRYEGAQQASDLFSLGVLLYESLTGRRLYRCEKAAWRIVNEAPPDLSDELFPPPEEVRTLISSLLAKQPEDRPSSAAEVARILERSIASLVDTEGAISIQDYTRDALSEEHERHRTWLAEKLEASQPGGTATISLVQPELLPETTTDVADRATRIIEQPRSGWKAALVMTGIVLVFGGVVLALSAGGSDGAVAEKQEPGPTDLAAASVDPSVVSEFVETEAEEPLAPVVDSPVSARPAEPRPVNRPRMHEGPRLRPTMARTPASPAMTTPAIPSLGWDET